MPRPRFTSVARRDLVQIIRYIAKYDPAAALRINDRIEAESRRLARNAMLGQLRPDLGADIRFFPCGNYLLFYRPSVEGIQVLRILHGARDYGAGEFS